jgi:hypothetical protein
MDSLKSRVTRKPKKSRVQQFYSDFNSDAGSASSDSDNDNNNSNAGGGHVGDAAVFTFQTAPRAPVLRPDADDLDVTEELNGSSADSSLLLAAARAVHPPPMSPGLTRNQDLKDTAFQIIFQKKIKDLKRKQLQSSKCFESYTRRASEVHKG